MKLKDCDCGGIPEVNYNLNDDIKFVVRCSACGNQTPICKSIKEAAALWNKVYCIALPKQEIESAV